MFTKPTGTPSLGFASKTTPVPANWFNYVSNNFPDIFDATGGGTWQNVGDIVFKSSSNKFKLNYPDVAHQIELKGFVTFDLSDIGGMPVGVGGFTCNLETTFNSQVVFDGASGVTFSTPVTFDTDGDITLETGCAVTAESGSSITVEPGATLTIDDVTLGGDITFSAPRSHTVGPTGLAGVVDADWTAELGGTRYKQVAGSLSAVGWIFNIPDGSTITGVSVYIDPANTHGALPATMPVLQLHDIDPSNGSSTQISTTTDSSASVVVFEAGHTITSAVLSYAVPAARVIQARVYGESGANSTGDGVYWAPLVTYTRTTFSEI